MSQCDRKCDKADMAADVALQQLTQQSGHRTPLLTASSGYAPNKATVIVRVDATPAANAKVRMTGMPAA